MFIHAASSGTHANHYKFWICFPEPKHETHPKMWIKYNDILEHKSACSNVRLCACVVVTRPIWIEVTETTAKATM